MKSRILRAIYEGLDKSLILFDDGDDVSFKKSSNIDNSTADTCLVTSRIEDAIYSKNLFIPKELSCYVTRAKYDMEYIDDNKIAIYGEAWYLGAPIPKHCGVVVEVDGRNITIHASKHHNVLFFNTSKEEGQEIVQYIEDLKNLVGSDVRITNFIKYEEQKYKEYAIELGQIIDYINVFPTIYVRKIKDYHNSLDVIDNYIEEESQSLIVLTNHNRDSFSNNEIAYAIRKFRNFSTCVFIDYHFFGNRGNYMPENIYYDNQYNVDIDEKIKEYNMKIDTSDITKFLLTCLLSPGMLYSMDPTRKNIAMEQYRPKTANLELLKSEKNPKKIDMVVNKQIVRFATMLYVCSLPFDRDYIMDNLDIDMYHTFPSTLPFYPGKLIVPIIEICGALNLSLTEILDRIEFVYRTMLHLGLNGFCKFIESQKRK